MTNTTTTYQLTDVPSGVTTEIEATDLDDAREQARDWAREGYEASDSTFWVNVRISRRVPPCDHPRMGSPTDTVDARTCTECGERCSCEEGEPCEVDMSECPIHGSSGEEEWEEVETITEARSA